MRALHKSADHKPGRNLTVNFVTKHGQTGIGSTHKSAHNNLRPTWIHPFCERARKESLWGVSLLQSLRSNLERLVRRAFQRVQIIVGQTGL